MEELKKVPNNKVQAKSQNEKVRNFEEVVNMQVKYLGHLCAGWVIADIDLVEL